MAMLDFSNLHKEKNLSRNGRDRLFSFTIISNNNWYKLKMKPLKL